MSKGSFLSRAMVRRSTAPRKVLSSGLSFLLLYTSAAAPLAQAASFSPITNPGQEFLTQEDGGFFNPHNIRERLENQSAVVREMRRREERQENQKTKSLEKVIQNIQDVIQTKFANQEEFRAEVERRQRAAAAIFGEGGLFNFVKYADGKRVWFKGGQVAKVEGERITDGHGQTSVRNMDQMQYDSRGLLVSYRGDTTDAQGNKQTVYWHGATYSDDSRAYGGEGSAYKKLMTGYTEEITDDKGNTRTVDWRGAVYNDANQVTNYTQTTTDILGNQTTTVWKDGQYDSLGRLTSFDETTTDSSGLISHRVWSGGTYEKNPSYVDNEKTPNLSQYNLTGYHEEVTDNRGQTTIRDWTNATYDQYGDITSYREITKKTASDSSGVSQTLTQTVIWSGGQYDEFGHVTQYDEQKTAFDGTQTNVAWRNGAYDDHGRMTSYDEKTVDQNGNATLQLWRATSDSAYDDKNRLTSYTETDVDARGNSTKKIWSADSFDNHGRALGYTEIDADPHGNLTTKTWTTDAAGYDVYGQLLHYNETDVDQFGNRTSKSWSDAVYDSQGRLTSYEETTTDLYGEVSRRTWANGTYDAQGRVTSYVETRVDPDGNTEISKWSGAVYGDNGHLLGYHEEITDTYGQTNIKDWQAAESDYDSLNELVGYTELVTYFDGTQTQRQRSGATYDQLGQLSGYRDELTTTQRGVGTADDPLANTTLVTHEEQLWQGESYDAFGRLTGYTELIQSDNAPLQTKIWSGTYDTKGELICSREKFDSGRGIVTDTTMNAYGFDSRGRTTDSRQIEISSDQPGIAVITNVSGRTFDRYNQASGGQESVVQAGVASDGRTVHLTQTTNISNAVYSNGALQGYTQSTHSFGTDLDLTWQDYREETVVSNLSRTGYTERTTTTSGTATNPITTVSVTTRSQIVRDWQGRMISYTDVIQDQGAAGPRTVQRLATVFAANGDLAATAEKIQTPDGTAQTKTTTDIVQDGKGEILSFVEKTKMIDSGEEQTRTRLSSTYDALGRLVASEETVQSTFQSGIERVSWKATRFDRANKVASDETITEKFDGTSSDGTSVSGTPSSIQDSIRTLITYNAQGQIAGYRERFKDSMKPDTVIDRQVSDLTYDVWGQIATSHEIAFTQGFDDASQTYTKGSLNTETIRSNAQFDSSGRLIGFRETTHETGRAENGDLINHVTVQSRIATVYDSDKKDRVLEYTDEITDSASPGLLTTVTRTNMAFDSRNNVTEYQETTAKSGSLESRDPLNPQILITTPYLLTETVHRSNIVTSDNGNVLSYTETNQSSDRPAEMNSVVWSGTYDEKNRLTSSHEEATTSVSGDIQSRTVTDRSNISYDSQNRVTGYTDTAREQIRLDDGTLSAADQVTTMRSNMAYNSLQQLVSYQETERHSSTPEIKQTTFQDARYDTAGRLERFTQDTRTTSSDPAYELDSRVERTQTLYNGFGQISDMTEVKTSSDKPDLVVVDQTNDITYDSQGLQYSFVLTESQRSGTFDFLALLSGGSRAVTVQTVRDSTAYDSRGRVSGSVDEILTVGSGIQTLERIEKSNQRYNAWDQLIYSEETDWSSASPDKSTSKTYTVDSYDAQGRALHTVQRTASGDGHSSDEWSVSERSNIVYNALGQMTGYHETYTSSSDNAPSQTDWTGVYDSEGRLVEFTQAQAQDLAGTGAPVTTTTHRSQIRYDGYGNLLSYEESSQSSAMPLVTSSLSWHATGYNTAGQMSGFEQTKQTTGPDLLVVETENRKNITYLQNGLVNGFVDETTSSKTPGVVNTVSRISIGYDRRGLESTFKQIESTVSEDGSLNVNVTRERTGSTYNSQDQLIGKTELVRSDAAPLVADHVTWAGTYSANGLLAGYRETTRSIGRDADGTILNKTTIQDVTSQTYDNAGRLVQQTSSMDNGTGQITARTWVASGFDASGNLTGETENLVTAGGGLEIHTATTRVGMSYDNQGRLVAYDESKSDSSTGMTTLSHIVGITYNQNGQKLSETTDSFVNDTATGGAIYSDHMTTVRDQMTYDAKGRSISFVETTTDADAGTMTRLVQNQTTYNALGLQTGSDQTIEKTSLTNGVADGVLDVTSHVTSQVLAFNSLGQASRTLETSWSSAAPDVIETVRMDAMTYNAAGQLFSYHRLQQDASVSDASSLTTFQDEVRVGTTYDVNGRVASTHRVVFSSDAASVKQDIQESMNYNAVGERTNLSTTVHKTTRDGSLDMIQTQSVTSSFDRQGQLSHDTSVETNSQMPGLTTTTETSYLYGEAGLLSDRTAVTTVDGRAPPMSSADAQAILSGDLFANLTNDQKSALQANLINGEIFHSQSTVERTDISYDNQGRQLAYTETRVSSENPSVAQTTRHSDVQLNDRGQEISYTELVTQISSDPNQPLNTFTLTHRTNAAYDSLGRLVTYTDQIQDQTAVTKTVQQRSADYNLLGQVISRSQTITQTGTDSQTHEALNITTNVDQSKIGYDTQGRMNSYTEETHSSATGDSVHFWSASSFDAFGQASLIRESGNSGQDGAWSRDTQNLLFDQNGRALLVHTSGTSTTSGDYDSWTTNLDQSGHASFGLNGEAAYLTEVGTKHGLGAYVRTSQSNFGDSYDSTGRLVHSRETISSASGVTTTDTRQVYDALGLVIQKDSTVSDDKGAAGREDSVIHWTGSYDDQGRQLSFTNLKTTDLIGADGGLLGHETDTETRTGIQYNNHGQVAGYSDTTHQTSLDASGELIQETTGTAQRSNMAYNADGQLTHYEETGVQNAASYNETFDATQFASSGEAIVWSRRGTNQATGPIFIDQTSGAINELGQLVSYTQTGVSQGQFFTKSLSNTRYDGYGRVISSSESGETDSGSYQNTQTLTYDAFGRITATNESGRDAQGAYTSSTNGYQYDNQGRAIRKETRRTDARGQVTVTDWDASNGYDAQGRLAQTNESETIRDASGQLVSQTTRNWVVADFLNNGMAKEATTTSTVTKADGSTETDVSKHTNGDLNAQGYATSTIDDVTTTLVDASGQRTESQQVTTRTNISRYTQSDQENASSQRAGRISGYDEKVVASGSDSPVYSRKTNVVYDEKGDEVSFDKATLTSGIVTRAMDAASGFADQIFSALANAFHQTVNAAASLFASRSETTAVAQSESLSAPQAFPVIDADNYSLDIVHQTNGQKDELGRLVSWTETRRSSTASSKLVTSEVHLTYQGSGSDLATYDATTVENIDGTTKTTHTTQNNYVYQNGRIVSVQGHVHEEATDGTTGLVTLDHDYDTSDVTLAWDNLGRATKTQQITTNDTAATGVTRTETSDLSYDAQGRVSERKTRTQQSGSDVDSWTETEATYTYGANNQVVHTEQTSTNSQKPGEVATTKTDLGDFDNQGRAQSVTTDQTIDFQGVTTRVTTTDQITSFSADGQAVNLTRTTVTEKGSITTTAVQNLQNTYDTLGRSIKTKGDQTQTEVTLADDGSLLSRVVTTGDIYTQNLSFNDAGQVTEVRRRNTTQTSIAYDASGNETGRLIKDDGGVTTEKYTYNKAGQIQTLVESAVYGGTAEFAKVDNETTYTYDASGLAVDTVTKTTTRTQGLYEHSYVTETIGHDRDQDGNFTNFTRITSGDTEAPGRTITEVNTNAVYDKKGNLLDSDIVSTEADLNSGGSPSSIVQDLHRHQDYNALGLQTGHWELNRTLVQQYEDQLNAPSSIADPNLIPALQDKITSIEQDRDAALAQIDQQEAQAKADWDKRYTASNNRLWAFVKPVAYQNIHNTYEAKRNQAKQDAEDKINPLKHEIEINQVSQLSTYEAQDAKLTSDLAAVNQAYQREITQVTNARDGELSQKDQQIAAAQNQLSNLQSRLAGVNSQIKGWQDDIKALQQKISKMSNRDYAGIQTAQNQIDQDTRNIRTATRTQQSLNSQISQTNAAIAGLNQAKVDITNSYAKQLEGVDEKYQPQIGWRQNQLDLNQQLEQAAKDDKAHTASILQSMQDNGKTSWTKDVVYDDHGRVQGEKDWDAQTGVWTTNSGYTYNQAGQATGYTKTYVGSATSKVDTVQLAYGYDGRLKTTTTATQEMIDGQSHTLTTTDQIVSLDSNGRVKEESRTVVDSNSPLKKDTYSLTNTYDAQGRAAVVTTVHGSEANGSWTYLDKETVTTLSFDSLGRIQSYDKSSTSAAEPDVKTTTTGKNLYGKDGQLVGNDDVIRKVGDVLNTSQHVVTVASKFDNNRPVEQTRLTDRDSTQPGKSVLDHIVISYGAGLNNTTTTMRREAAPQMDTRTMTLKEVNSFDSSGRLSSKVTVTSNDSYFDPSKVVTITQSGFTYDSLGRQTGYQEESSDTTTPDENKVVNRSGMTYNADGLLNAFHETEDDVVRDIAGTSYNERGQVSSQVESRTWNGTVAGNISGLSSDWTQGSVNLVQQYSYDSLGRISGYVILASGSGMNATLSGLAVAGTGANQTYGGYFSLDPVVHANGFTTYNRTFHQTGAAIRFELHQSNIQYDSKGRVIHYDQSSTQYEKTTENYNSSSRSWTGKRKVKSRDVIGLVTRNESVDTLEFNSFGQATKTFTKFSLSTGDYGWTKQTNITYDSHGRMAGAQNENYYHTSGKGYTAEFHSSKLQTYAYDAQGKLSKTNDVRVDYDDKTIHASKSGNFFASDIGKAVKIGIVVAATVLSGGNMWVGAIVGLIIDMAVMDRMGASPSQMWKSFAIEAAVDLAVAGQGSGLKTAGKEGLKSGAQEVAANAAKEAVKDATAKQLVATIMYRTVTGFLVLKGSERVAARNGAEAAAVFSILANAFTPQMNQPGKGYDTFSKSSFSDMRSFNSTLLEAAGKSGVQVGLMEIARNNSRAGQDQSWLLAALQGSTDLISSAVGSSFGIALGYRLNLRDVSNDQPPTYNRRQDGISQDPGTTSLLNRVQAVLIHVFGQMMGVNFNPSRNSDLNLLGYGQKRMKALFQGTDANEQEQKTAVAENSQTGFMAQVKFGIKGFMELFVQRADYNRAQERQEQIGRYEKTPLALAQMKAFESEIGARTSVLTKKITILGKMLQTLGYSNDEVKAALSNMVPATELARLSKGEQQLQAKQQEAAEAIKSNDLKSADKALGEFSALASHYQKVASQVIDGVNLRIQSIEVIKNGVSEILRSRLSGTPLDRTSKSIMSELKLFMTLRSFGEHGLLPLKTSAILGENLGKGLSEADSRMMAAKMDNRKEAGADGHWLAQLTSLENDLKSEASKPNADLYTKVSAMNIGRIFATGASIMDEHPGYKGKLAAAFIGTAEAGMDILGAVLKYPIVASLAGIASTHGMIRLSDFMGWSDKTKERVSVWTGRVTAAGVFAVQGIQGAEDKLLQWGVETALLTGAGYGIETSASLGVEMIGKEFHWGPVTRQAVTSQISNAGWLLVGSNIKSIRESSVSIIKDPSLILDAMAPSKMKAETGSAYFGFLERPANAIRNFIGKSVDFVRGIFAAPVKLKLEEVRDPKKLSTQIELIQGKTNHPAMKDFAGEVGKILGESGDLTTRTLSAIDEVRIKLGLSERQAGSLFGNKGLFSGLSVLRDHSFEKMTASVELSGDPNSGSKGADLRIRIPTPEGVKENSIRITLDGVEGQMFDSIKTLGRDAVSMRSLDKSFEGLLRDVDGFIKEGKISNQEANAFKLKFEEVMKNVGQVQGREAYEGQSQKIEGANTKTSGADIKNISNEAQQGQANARGISGEELQIPNQSDGSLRGIQSSQESIGKDLSDRKSIRPISGQGESQSNGSAGENRRNFSRSGQENLIKENLEEALKNHSVKNITNIRDSIRDLIEMVRSQKDTSENSAAFDLAEIYGNKAQIELIQKKYADESSSKGRNVLNGDEIDSKRVEYQKALKVPLESLETLLAQKLPAVRDILAEAISKPANQQHELDRIFDQKASDRAEMQVQKEFTDRLLELLPQLKELAAPRWERAQTLLKDQVVKIRERGTFTDAEVKDFFNNYLAVVAEKSGRTFVVERPKLEALRAYLKGEGIGKPRLDIKADENGRVPITPELLAKYKWDFEVGRFGKTAVEGVQGEFLTYRGKLVLSDLDGIAMKGDVGSSVYRDPVLGDTNSKANALIEDKNSVAREVLGTKLVQHSDAALYRAEKVQSPKYRDLIAAEPGGKVFELNTVENAKSFFQKHGIQPNLKWEGWQKGLESNVKNFDLNPSPSVEEFIKTADTFEQKGAEQSYIDKTGPPGGGGFVESVKKPFLWARDLFVTQPRSVGEPFTPGSHDRNTILYGIDPLTLKAQKDLNDLSPERLHAVDRDDRKFQLIEVTKDGVVRDGHHRLKLAIQEGRAVDVIIVD